MHFPSLRTFSRLTFHIQLYKSWLTHAQGILSNTFVSPRSVPCHGTDGDFPVRTEDSVDTFFFPPNFGSGVALGMASHCHRIFAFLKVRQRCGFRNDIWWVYKHMQSNYELAYEPQSCTLQLLPSFIAWTLSFRRLTDSLKPTRPHFIPGKRLRTAQKVSFLELI